MRTHIVIASAARTYCHCERSVAIHIKQCLSYLDCHGLWPRNDEIYAFFYGKYIQNSLYYNKNKKKNS